MDQTETWAFALRPSVRSLGSAASASMAAHIARAVGGAGLREYYDPFSGTGMGAEDFSWSAVVLDMVDPDPEACRSHIGV